VIGNRHGFYRPAGGFYLWLDVGDGEAAAEALWRKAALRTLPGRYLSRENGAGAASPYLRIALVADADATREAMDRIRDTL
jgi:aspartate/methionine/tyrosine aminotransferase